jgi:transcriptional regulator with XRE-family HTH domain
MTPAAIPPDDSTYSGRVASRLKELRLKAGLTVEEVVEVLASQGVSVAVRTYYSWESGSREPPFNTLPAIAIALKQKSPRSLLPPD